MTDKPVEKTDRRPASGESPSDQPEFDWDRFSPNAMVALAVIAAIFLSPAYYWSISEKMLVWLLSTTNRPFLGIMRYLEGKAIWWPEFLSYEALLDGRAFYEAFAPLMSAMTLLLGVSIARIFVVRALERTEEGRCLIEDIEERNPRGEATLASLQAFVRFALLYFLWHLLSPFLPDGGVEASFVNTVLFISALMVFYKYLALVALAGQREEAENPEGVKAVLRWWKIVPATVGAVTLLITIQQVVDLFF